MAEAHFNYSMSDDGFIQFRMPLPLGTRAQAGFHPAADGHTDAQPPGALDDQRFWINTADHKNYTHQPPS